MVTKCDFVAELRLLIRRYERQSRPPGLAGARTDSALCSWRSRLRRPIGQQDLRIGIRLRCRPPRMAWPLRSAHCASSVVFPLVRRCD